MTKAGRSTSLQRSQGLSNDDTTVMRIAYIDLVNHEACIFETRSYEAPLLKW